MKILQLSDTHLFSSNDQTMFDISSNEKLKKLIDHLLESKLLFEKIFLTGDVSQDMSAESYQYAVSQLIRFEKPIYWIPGNHDNLSTMSNVFKESHYFNSVRHLKEKHYSFIFLNTKYKDLDTGYFNQEDETLIEDILKNTSQDENFCVVMHHHPIKTGTPLIDNYILENTDRFWEVIDRHPNIKHIICGHVHGDYTLQHKNVTLHTSMATCLQWKKGTQNMTIEKVSGCKLYELSENTILAKSISLGE